MPTDPGAHPSPHPTVPLSGRLNPVFTVLAKLEHQAPAATRNLDFSGGQLHVLCPAGIGDFYWIWQKWANIARRRRVTFHFPGGEQNRAGELCDLVGARHAYMPRLSTQWVWNRESEPEIPNARYDPARSCPVGGWTTAQANRHLEAGRPLAAWYPGLPQVRPELRVTPEQGADPYCLAFLCHRDYMQGNLSAEAWGRVLQRVHNEIAPVRIVGAGRDLQFAAEVQQHYHSGRAHMFNRHFKEVVAAAMSARLMVGVAGGPSIVATQYCPTVIAYPNWLVKMPGTWENTDERVYSLLMPELERRILGMPGHALRSLSRR